MVTSANYQYSGIGTFRKSESIEVHNENNDNNDYLHNLKTTARPEVRRATSTQTPAATDKWYFDSR